MSGETIEEIPLGSMMKEVWMTSLRERVLPPETARPEPAGFTLELLLGLLGAVAAAVGAYIYYAPGDGVLEVFGWSWDVTAIADEWPLALLIGGGVALFGAFAILARRLFTRAGSATTSVVVATILALAALGGAVTYALLWLL